MLDGTIADLIIIDIPPSTAAAATTVAYHMEIDTLASSEADSFTEVLYLYQRWQTPNTIHQRQ